MTYSAFTGGKEATDARTGRRHLRLHRRAYRRRTGAANHDVVCAVREARVESRFRGSTAIAYDMNRDVQVDDWLPRLDDIDAVVNAAGILREHENAKFATAEHRCCVPCRHSVCHRWCLLAARGVAAVARTPTGAACGQPRRAVTRRLSPLHPELVFARLAGVCRRAGYFLADGGETAGVELITPAGTASERGFEPAVAY